MAAISCWNCTVVSEPAATISAWFPRHSYPARTGRRTSQTCNRVTTCGRGWTASYRHARLLPPGVPKTRRSPGYAPGVGPPLRPAAVCSCGSLRPLGRPHTARRLRGQGSAGPCPLRFPQGRRLLCLWLPRPS
jgi:hypothetical protein